MANAEHLEILKQGVEVWNKWRQDNIEVKPDLNRAYVTSDLSKANLRNTNLKLADLSKLTLEDIDFGKADLSSVSFRYSSLKGTNFSNATLDNADLRSADLSGANLSGACLSNADFSDARIASTVFGDNDLRQVKGLAVVRHGGPSLISGKTFDRSDGRMSVSFLKGCGLSDWEIESAKLYQHDLRNEELTEILYKIHDLRAHQAIQINPLFISYSHRDATFVDLMETSLNDKGIRFWRDSHHTIAGRLEKQIDRAIHLNPIVLLILSRNSIDSDWVQHEARLARKIEQETKRDVLCPVALDDSWKSCDWPQRLLEQIMEYNILDFSDWKTVDQFRRTFNRLLDGLDLFYN